MGYRDVLGDSDSDSDEVLHSESRFLVHRDHQNHNDSRGSASKIQYHQSGRLSSHSICQSVRSLNTNPTAARSDISHAVASLVSQLSELTVADWTTLYISPPQPQQSDERSFAFSELASVSTDLEAVLSKLKAAKEEMSRQQQQLEDTHNSSSNVCCICLDAPKSILVMPCRHFCVCAGCAKGGSGSAARPLRLCPVCRTHVTECLQVYS